MNMENGQCAYKHTIGNGHKTTYIVGELEYLAKEEIMGTCSWTVAGGGTESDVTTWKRMFCHHHLLMSWVHQSVLRMVLSNWIIMRITSSSDEDRKSGT